MTIRTHTHREECCLLTMIRAFDEEDLRVLTEEGFIARYEQECKQGVTYKKAYELTEDVYEHITGVKRYKSANAFRQLLYRRRKRGRKSGKL